MRAIRALVGPLACVHPVVCLEIPLVPASLPTAFPVTNVLPESRTLYAERKKNPFSDLQQKSTKQVSIKDARHRLLIEREVNLSKHHTEIDWMQK